MEQGPLRIIWTPKATEALDVIHEFYAARSLNAANNMIKGIIDTAESIIFPEQYQFDEIDREGRRMIFRHFKIFYGFFHDQIFILDIIDSRMDPSKDGQPDI